jgi:hypothetical protein
VATRQLVDGLVQSFARDAPLEVDRKEPIVAPRDHVYRNLGPRFETAGLGEHDLGLGTLMPFALLNDLGRHVVQEVRGEVELRAVAAALCSFCPRCRRPGVVPPLSSRLAGNRDHGVDEHQHAYANPRTHQRRGETAERLRDENHVSSPDRFNDAIGVGREARLFVVPGQVDRDRVMTRLFEERYDTVPVPRNTTSTRHENEGRHALLSRRLESRLNHEFVIVPVDYGHNMPAVG